MIIIRQTPAVCTTLNFFLLALSFTDGLYIQLSAYCCESTVLQLQC